MLLNPYNTINGCPNCKVIYVTDNGDSSGTGTTTATTQYSDEILIDWLLKRTKEKKLEWVAYKGTMEDHYPYVLDIGDVRFILNYNGRNIELRMYWIFSPDEAYKDNYPTLKTDSSIPGNDVTDDEWYPPYGWYYVVKEGSTAPVLPEPVVYLKFTEDEIEAVFEKWDYRKPARILLSDWFNRLFELNTAVKEYCNKWERNKTHYVDRFKESRNGIIDFLEEMG